MGIVRRFQLEYLLLVVSVVWIRSSNSCDTKFDGFGAYLGSTGDLNRAADDVIREVIDKLYFDLKLRYVTF